MRILASVLVLALALGGCLTPVTDQLDALDGKTPEQVLPHFDLGEGHDHKSREQHNVSWNMELVGWNPIAPSVAELGRYNQVVVEGTRAYVTAYALANNTPSGLAIFNLTNDTPALVATLETPDVTVIDVHATPDGKYAILAGHRDNRVALPAPIANTCSGTPGVNVCAPFVPNGVVLVDVSDETAPVVAATWASPPSGAHTAKILQHDDGSYYVFIASYGFSYLNRLASHVEILRVEDTPLGTRLTPVAEFFPQQPSGNDGVTSTFVHDMFVEKHPVTEQTLMWVAYWDGGVVIADVTDPTNPAQLAAWTEFDAALYGNIHFARPVGMVGERHITFAAPEFGSAEHAGEAYVLDTTDPAAPVLLTNWVLPGNPLNDGGYRFSPHNFDPYGTKLVYAHYHGGVWVLDVSTPETPVVKGYTFPIVPDGEPAFNSTEDAPLVWAAEWGPDGTIYASDIGTGLYRYRLLAEEPGVPPYEALFDG